MKQFFSLLVVAAVLLLGATVHAQTYGTGTVVGGTNWVYSQVSLGVNGTNFLSYNQPQRSLLMTGISSTNEAVTAYYGFTIPAGYYLLPGTTNIYVTSSTNFNFSAGTNGGTYSVTFPGIYGQNVGMQSVMGLAISPGGLTNNVTASP